MRYCCVFVIYMINIVTFEIFQKSIANQSTETFQKSDIVQNEAVEVIQLLIDL